MMNNSLMKPFVVRLPFEERQHLQGLASRGAEATFRRRHAQARLFVQQSEHGLVLLPCDNCACSESGSECPPCAPRREGKGRERASPVPSAQHRGRPLPSSFQSACSQKPASAPRAESIHRMLGPASPFARDPFLIIRRPPERGL